MPLLKAVYDCNIFLQALGNPDGPAGQCVQLAIDGAILLFISPVVMQEIRDVASRPKLIQKFRLRPEAVAALLHTLPRAANSIEFVAESWTYDRDPDDAHYVNLALAAGARLVVSRDRDLLDLMHSKDSQAQSLIMQHPDFQVLTPPELLSLVRSPR